MAEKLIIRLGDGGPVEWLALDEHGNRIGAIQSGELDTLAPHTAGRRVVVLVPGAAITLTGATLPSQNAQKIAQALPYALEEHLAEDVDNLHFVAGPVRPGGGRAVAVVARARMDEWLAALAAADIKVDVLLPETFAVAALPGRWHAALEADRGLVRTGPAGGFATDKDLIETLVALKIDALADAERPEALVIQAADPADPAVAALTAACAAAGVAVPAVDELPGGTALSGVGAGIAAMSGFNLLQGAYRPRRGWEQGWRRWRLAAALAIAWLVLAAAWQGIDYYRLHQRDVQLRQAVTAVFHRALPNTHRLVNARAQMAARLNELRGAGGTKSPLLSMLNALGTGLKAAGAADLKSLSYHNEVLDLQLTVPDVKTLDDLRGRLAAATQLAVAIESANAAGKSVDGRLRIGGAP